jgi:hypothetical protein
VVKGKRWGTARGFLVLAAAASAGLASAQLRIVQYNTTGEVRAGFETDFANVFRGIEKEVVNGISKPVDILTIQEAASQAEVNSVRDQLNAIYGAGTYVSASLQGTTSGGGLPGMVFRASSVLLTNSTGTPVTVTSGVAASTGSIAFGTVNTSANARSTVRYRVRPVGYDSTADFYLYNLHMKSSNTGTDETRRNVESTSIRANLDALGQGVHALVQGDFNFYGGSGSEAGYDTLIAVGNGKLVDPLAGGSINYPMNWAGNSSTLAKRYHTQSPATSSAYGGQITGGIDDRFDLQMSTEEFHDNEGLSFLAGSYRTFGINGTHALDAAANTAANTWTNAGLTGAETTAIKTSLTRVTDHLPVVADYQLPGIMSVNFSLPSTTRMIKNSIEQVTVTVTNTAPVSFVAGADEVDFVIGGTAVAGQISGADNALGGGATNSVSLITSTTGAKTGNITVTSSSQQVQNGSATQTVAYTVVDRANPSFSPLSDLNTTTVDFGYVPVGFQQRSRSLNVSNLVVTAGATANLDVDSITQTGSGLLTMVMPPQSIIAGGTANGNVLLNPLSAALPANKTITFNMSDEDIPGEGTHTITATATARVISSATFPVSGFIDLFASETYNTGPMSIGSGVTLNKRGGGTLNITGAQSHGAGSKLIVENGSVILGSDAGELSLDVQFASSVALTTSSRLASLTIANGGIIDTNTHDLIVDYSGASPIGTLIEYVNSGRLNADVAGNGGLPAFLAVSEAADLGLATFHGFAVDSSTVILKFTYVGDANLDGQVDALDYERIDLAIGNSGVFGTAQGDLNYDGAVDALDYEQIDLNIGNGVGDPLNGAVFIPEPAGLMSLLGVAALLVRRRPRCTQLA